VEEWPRWVSAVVSVATVAAFYFVFSRVHPAARRMRRQEQAIRARPPQSAADFLALLAEPDLAPDIPLFVRAAFAVHIALPTDRLRPDDDFTEILDDLDAIDLIEDIEQKCEVTISEADAAVTRPTIRNVVALVHRLRGFRRSGEPARPGPCQNVTGGPSVTVINFYSLHGEYGCFSNFPRHPIFLKGKRWRTSEHYFQAQKFAGTPDEEEVRMATKPMEAARMGRDRKRPLRRDWEAVKDGVMRDAVRAKFAQHPELAAVLLGTGDARLVEHTPNDSYWGDGGDGSGKNMLGQILMRVRAELRTAEPVGEGAPGAG